MKKLLLMTLTLVFIATSLGCTAVAMEEDGQTAEQTERLSESENTLVDAEDAEGTVDTIDTAEIVECYAGYGYTGVIAEVVNVGDNPETDFVEGSLVIEVEDNDLGAIIVYLTDDMSTIGIDNFTAGDTVQFMMDYELNFEGAKDVPHISPFTLSKTDNK